MTPRPETILSIQEREAVKDFNAFDNGMNPVVIAASSLLLHPELIVGTSPDIQFDVPDQGWSHLRTPLAVWLQSTRPPGFETKVHLEVTFDNRADMTNHLPSSIMLCATTGYWSTKATDSGDTNVVGRLEANPVPIDLLDPHFGVAFLKSNPAYLRAYQSPSAPNQEGHVILRVRLF